MPFEVKSGNLGELETVELIDSENDHHLVFIPDRGALPSKIKFFGQDIVEANETAEVLESDHAYRSFWLMPYPNRIGDGKYTFNGREYQLTVNETDKNNALHAFFYSLWADDINIEQSGDEVILTMDHVYQADQPGYPFPFDTTMQYKIGVDGTFDINLKVLNTGEQELPFGIGWHPYFTLDGEQSNWKTNCGPLTQVELDERNLPNGVEQKFEGINAMASMELDHCFRFESTPHKFELSSEKYQLILDSDENFNYLQVYTPGRNSIAIEPMTCGVNVFNTKQDLMIIKRGESRSFKIHMKVNKL